MIIKYLKCRLERILYLICTMGMEEVVGYNNGWYVIGKGER